MSETQLISEKPLSIADLMEEFEKIKQRDKELGYRTNKTLDYVNQFLVISKKDADVLFERLTKLNIPRLKDQHIKKIIDLMPNDVDQLKVILQDTLTLNNENMKRIIDVVNDYKPRK